MALIKCQECGTDVSSKATTCPNCGNASVKKKSRPIATAITLVFIALVAFVIYGEYLASNLSGYKTAQQSPCDYTGRDDDIKNAIDDSPAGQARHIIVINVDSVDRISSQSDTSACIAHVRTNGGPVIYDYKVETVSGKSFITGSIKSVTSSN